MKNTDSATKVKIDFYQEAGNNLCQALLELDLLDDPTNKNPVKYSSAQYLSPEEFERSKAFKFNVPDESVEDVMKQGDLELFYQVIPNELQYEFAEFYRPIESRIIADMAKCLEVSEKEIILARYFWTSQRYKAYYHKDGFKGNAPQVRALIDFTGNKPTRFIPFDQNGMVETNTVEKIPTSEVNDYINSGGELHYESSGAGEISVFDAGINGAFHSTPYNEADNSLRCLWIFECLNCPTKVYEQKALKKKELEKILQNVAKEVIQEYSNNNMKTSNKIENPTKNQEQFVPQKTDQFLGTKNNPRLPSSTNAQSHAILPSENNKLPNTVNIETAAAGAALLAVGAKLTGLDKLLKKFFIPSKNQEKKPQR